MKLLPLVCYLVGAAIAVPQIPSDIRARLDAYEKQVAITGSADPAALAAIARDVVGAARRSTLFGVWTEACGSTLVPESDQCGPRLWSVLNGRTATIGNRAEAAAALMARKEKGAAEKLFEVLGAQPITTIAPLAPIAARMPPRLAVRILTRLAESSSKTDQAAACQALSGIDTGESRAAISHLLGDNAPGSVPWLLCMIARARLREGVPAAALWGYGHTLQGEGLLFTARVMVETGHDSATQTLTDLTRRGPMADRLRAADLLSPLDPSVAVAVIEAAEGDGDAAVRAAALEAERRLKRVPTKSVRAMLADPSPLVRLRAAENAIEWASREQIR